MILESFNSVDVVMAEERLWKWKG